jgi:hypothetical protein
MYSKLAFENPRPNSSVGRAESSFSSSVPYSARFAPFCSCSTMRRPISKFVSTCSVLTVLAAVRRADRMRPRNSAISGLIARGARARVVMVAFFFAGMAQSSSSPVLRPKRYLTCPPKPWRRRVS